MATVNLKANELFDEIHNRLTQSAAICSLAAAGQEAKKYQITDAAIPDSMWVVRTLLSEANMLTERLYNLAIVTEVDHE